MLRCKRKPAILSRSRPTLEALEDRCLLTGNVLQTNLVSDLPGVAQTMDAGLVNPWGISESPGSPFWISDNNAGVATLYDTTGTPVTIVPTGGGPLHNQVIIPGPTTPTGGTPTGTVFNTSSGFAIPVNAPTGTPTFPAVFLFATEDGTIAAWSPKVNPASAVIAVDNSTNPSAANGAVYKGLAIATDSNGRTLLYASNFRSGQIDVFDTNFKPVTNLPAGAFTDPNLPKGYAPFDVQTLGTKIYVTYAKQDAAKHDDVAGPGNGFVDTYNLDGSGGTRLISRGQLNSPWGLAIAPSTFGSLSGDLLVGNFGDGRINVYDISSTSAKFVQPLKDPDGEPIQIDGLWAVKVGNGAKGGNSGTVYFTAGIDHEAHGLFGSLAPVAAGTPEGTAEAQTVQIALDVFQINLTTFLNDLSSGASKTTLKQDSMALNSSLTDLIQAEVHFAQDTRDDLSSPAAKPSVADLLHAALDAIFAQLGKL